MGERTANVQSADFSATLNSLAETIAARRGADPNSSYTARLLTGDTDYLLKKLVEEACELTLAVKDADHDHARYEAGDLLYHLLVLLERQGIGLDELAGELKARMK